MPVAGRPTKYRPEFCREILNYFRKPSPEGTEPYSYYPNMAGFACKIGVNKATLYDWAKINKKFNDAMGQAQAYMESQTFQGAVTEKYNPGFAKFIAINCLGMKSESTVAEVANTHSFPTGININFVGSDRTCHTDT